MPPMPRALRAAMVGSPTAKSRARVSTGAASVVGAAYSPPSHAQRTPLHPRVLPLHMTHPTSSTLEGQPAGGSALPVPPRLLPRELSRTAQDLSSTLSAPLLGTTTLPTVYPPTGGVIFDGVPGAPPLPASFKRTRAQPLREAIYASKLQEQPRAPNRLPAVRTAGQASAGTAASNSLAAPLIAKLAKGHALSEAELQWLRSTAAAECEQQLQHMHSRPPVRRALASLPVDFSTKTRPPPSLYRLLERPLAAAAARAPGCNPTMGKLAAVPPVCGSTSHSASSQVGVSAHSGTLWQSSRSSLRVLTKDKTWQGHGKLGPESFCRLDGRHVSAGTILLGA